MTDDDNKKITDFLRTDIQKPELKIALKVIKEFKSCESQHEWLAIPFSAWAKLEQLEEYLEHLVNGKELSEDTIRYMNEGNKATEYNERTEADEDNEPSSTVGD
jgi:hypothetical protein